jgi:O-antigen ligase
MLVALFLTFSRDVLIVLACMVIIHFLSLPAFSQAKRSKRLKTIFTVFLIIAAYIFLSHIVVTSNNEAAIHELVGGEYIKGEKPLFTFGESNNGFAIYPSIYLELKRMAFRAFLDSGGVGVGGGNFNQYLSVLKNEGLYPEKFTSWDPHSTYFGVLAEHGLVGFLIVCGTLGYLCRKSFLRLHSQASRDFVSIGFAGVFFGVAIEAICVDIMNFRQYWVLFALAAALFSKSAVSSALLDRK